MNSIPGNFNDKKTTHSEAEVKAALDRETRSDPSTPQLIDFFSVQNSLEEEHITNQNQREGLKISRPQGQHHSSVVDWGRHGSGVEGQDNCSLENSRLPLQQKLSLNDRWQQLDQNAAQFSHKVAVEIPHIAEQQDRVGLPDYNQDPFPRLQTMNNQPPPAAEQANNPLSQNKQVLFGKLLPAILPHLDKDRAMQLTTLFAKLRSNEINGDGFVRLIRSIVGDKMLRLTFHTVQQELAKDEAAQNSQTGPHQILIHSQVSSTATPLRAGTNVKTPPKKFSIGPNKPLDALGTPSPVGSKMQNVSGASLNQHTEQPNDVTAVNLRVMGRERHERHEPVLSVGIRGKANTVRGEPSTAASSLDDQVRTLREEVEMLRRDREERLRKEDQLEESLRSTRENLERHQSVIREMRMVLQSAGQDFSPLPQPQPLQ